MNSTPNPILPPPQPETIRALAPPWWKSRTILSAITAAVTGLPALVTMLFNTPELQTIITAQVRPWLALISLVATWCGIVFAKQAGVEAGARVAEIPGNGGGVVTSAEAQE